MLLQGGQRVRGAGFSKGQLKGPPDYSMCAHVFISLCYSHPVQLLNPSGHLHQTLQQGWGLKHTEFLLLTLGIRKGERSQSETPQRRRTTVWAHLFISHQRTHMCSRFQRHWCYWPPKHPHCRGTGSLDSQVPLLTEQLVRLRSFCSAGLGSPKNLQWWLDKNNTLWCWRVIRRKRTRTVIKTVEATFSSRTSKRGKKKKQIT